MKGGIKFIKPPRFLINYFKSERNQITKDFVNILSKLTKVEKKKLGLFCLLKIAMLQNLA